MENRCDAVVVHCFDYRIQEPINDFLKQNGQTYDRISLAGGVREAVPVLHYVGMARELHRVHSAILINHEGCLAYGTEGSFLRHAVDLLRMSEVLREVHRGLNVRPYILRSDGVFMPIKKQ